MKIATKQNNIRERRVRRVRAKIFGTAARPRVAFFRSNTGNYAQAINDEEMKTLASASSRDQKTQKKAAESKSASATRCGALLAEKLKQANVVAAVFDRRGHKYHGRVKLFVEGLRKGGIRV